jgi:hypothetical protein
MLVPRLQMPNPALCLHATPPAVLQLCCSWVVKHRPSLCRQRHPFRVRSSVSRLTASNHNKVALLMPASCVHDLQVVDQTSASQSRRVVLRADGFRLFATQNPSGGLFRGKRERLSPSLLTRFTPVVFRELPPVEWRQVVEELLRRAGVPEPTAEEVARKMVGFHGAVEAVMADKCKPFPEVRGGGGAGCGGGTATPSCCACIGVGTCMTAMTVGAGGVVQLSASHLCRLPGADANVRSTKQLAVHMHKLRHRLKLPHHPGPLGECGTRAQWLHSYVILSAWAPHYGTFTPGSRHVCAAHCASRSQFHSWSYHVCATNCASRSQDSSEASLWNTT